MGLKKFPTKGGWVHADIHLRNRYPIGDEGLQACKNLITGGQPDGFEFGLIEQHGDRLKMITRLRFKCSDCELRFATPEKALLHKMEVHDGGPTTDGEDRFLGGAK
jgi:hypothetical protein